MLYILIYGYYIHLLYHGLRCTVLIKTLGNLGNYMTPFWNNSSLFFNFFLMQLLSPICSRYNLFMLMF